MSYNIATLNPAVSDWTAWTPTGSWTSNVTYQGKYRRLGDSLEAIVHIVCSSDPDAVGLTINLPAGLTIDTAKLPSGTQKVTPCGAAIVGDNGVADYRCDVVVNNSMTTSVSLRVCTASGTYLDVTNAVSDAAPIDFKINDAIIVRFTVPISGWSSNIQTVQASTEYASNYGLADSDDTTSFAYGPSGSQMQNASLGANRVRRVKFLSPIQLTDVLSIEVSEDGGLTWYPISSSVATNWWSYTLIHNANAAYGIGINAKVDSNTISVVFGQYKYWINSGGVNWSSNTAKWRVRKSSGLGAGEVPPTVNARYYRSGSSQTLTVGNEVLDFNTKSEDTHGAVTTGSGWKFTAPENGIYLINCVAAIYGVFTAADSLSTILQKNGSDVEYGDENVIEVTATRYQRCRVSSTIRLVAGDYISVKSASPRAGHMYNSSLYSFIEITKVGV